MPRTPARATQADIARALRAAAQAGDGWAVIVEPDGTIRFERQPDPPQPLTPPEAIRL